MKASANHRYLLARPRGGLNDTLVQLERMRRYAVRFGRTLVVDLSRSGLHTPIDDIFTVRRSFGCRVIPWSPGLAAELDQFPSVYPSAFTHRVSNYESAWNHDELGFCDTESGTRIDFDQSRDYPETLLIYEQPGRDGAAEPILRQLAFAPRVANTVATRLLTLGGSYDAMHVRHTDYKTDYEHLLKRARPMFRGRKLVICSDNRAVLHAARQLLHPSTTLLTVSNIPDTNGAPLHWFQDRTPDKAFDECLDLFSDLMALVFSDRLLFTHLQPNRPGLNATHSGFSLLAESLRGSRDTVSGLFEHAEPELAKRLLSAEKVEGRVPLLRGLQRRWSYLAQWSWNRPLMLMRLSNWATSKGAPTVSWRKRPQRARPPACRG